jgi:hypothetical protein
MTERNPSDNERRYSRRSVDGAAVHWTEKHPEDDVDHPAPNSAPEDDDIVPNRHSASAEAAHLRWHEQHEDHDG